MKLLLFVLLALLLLTFRTSAQEGFKVGIDVPMISFFSGDVPFDPAVGFNLRFPYGIDNNLSVGAKIGGAIHNVKRDLLWITRNGGGFLIYSYGSKRWTLWWVLVDCKYLIGDSAATRPFINGELGYGFLVGDWDNQLNGFAIGGGGGVEHVLADRWSMNVAADIRYHDFRAGTVGGSSARLREGLGQVVITASVGLTYHIPR